MHSIDDIRRGMNTQEAEAFFTEVSAFSGRCEYFNDIFKQNPW